MTSFCITVNLGGNPTNPGQATTYQFVTPWGQTDPNVSWEGAINQAFRIGSLHTGRQGMYFTSGLTNGLATSSQTAPTSATPIRNG